MGHRHSLERSNSSDNRVGHTENVNEILKTHGSCLVELDNHVLLHVLHVNTVGNHRFSSLVYSKPLRKYARLQSNTTKTELATRLKFVSDKKRLCSQHGYKNTRIEFASTLTRSANYTSNAKHTLQPYFRGLFETIALSQGSCIISSKPFMVCNENLTSYIYGVANPLSVIALMKNTKKHFHTPFFFSSVNVAGEATRHQLFVSMSINSQKVRNVAEELPKALSKMAKLVEVHVHLNRLCCELAHERGGMLTSREKICLVYLTELHFLHIKNRDDARYWPDYRESVKGNFVKHFRSTLSSFQDKVLNNYHLRNPEFTHLIPWLLDNPCALHNTMILAHEAYLRHEGKVMARIELISTVRNHIQQKSEYLLPEGFQIFDSSDTEVLRLS